MKQPYLAGLLAATTFSLASCVGYVGPGPDVAVGVEAAPICPYGYFDYAPYSCAPYGYYGPEWFNGGVFIGVPPIYAPPPVYYPPPPTYYYPPPYYGYYGY